MIEISASHTGVGMFAFLPIEDMKHRPIGTSSVMYRCPMCGNDDEFTEFCSGCAVEFSQKPFEIFDIESEDVISVKCEKCGYQSDPSEFLIE